MPWFGSKKGFTPLEWLDAKEARSASLISRFPFYHGTQCLTRFAPKIPHMRTVKPVLRLNLHLETNSLENTRFKNYTYG